MSLIRSTIVVYLSFPFDTVPGSSKLIVSTEYFVLRIALIIQTLETMALLLRWSKRQPDNSDVISSLCGYYVHIIMMGLGIRTDVSCRLYCPGLLIIEIQAQVQFDEFGYITYLYIVVSICRNKYSVLTISYNIHIEMLGESNRSYL